MGGNIWSDLRQEWRYRRVNYTKRCYIGFHYAWYQYGCGHWNDYDQTTEDRIRSEMELLIEFNGLKILLLAEDYMVAHKNLEAADVGIRVCRGALPTVDNSPRVLVFKNL